MSKFTLTYRRPDMEAPVQLEFNHETHDWTDVANFVSAQQFPGVAIKTPLWLDVLLAQREREAA